ncbi:hypothetical protein M0R19_03600 [Candidatus Pacearchaeota archaeon]|jgi:hypothetical protein|nr:hypothetical protein [Candidatus Pacearchaeota archaeon]
MLNDLQKKVISQLWENIYSQFNVIINKEFEKTIDENCFYDEEFESYLGLLREQTIRFLNTTF